MRSRNHECCVVFTQLTSWCVAVSPTDASPLRLWTHTLTHRSWIILHIHAFTNILHQKRLLNMRNITVFSGIKNISHTFLTHARSLSLWFVFFKMHVQVSHDCPTSAFSCKAGWHYICGFLQQVIQLLMCSLKLPWNILMLRPFLFYSLRINCNSTVSQTFANCVYCQKICKNQRFCRPSLHRFPWHASIYCAFVVPQPILPSLTCAAWGKTLVFAQIKIDAHFKHNGSKK